MLPLHKAWKGQVDLDLIKALNGCDNVECIEELQLCDLNLKVHDLKPQVFNKLLSLVELNLSGNKLTKIPSGILLDNLKYLDMSNNCLESVEWLVAFPKLVDVDIADNSGLTIDDSYKVIFLLKNLEFLDGKRVEEREKMGKKFTQELVERMQCLWREEFSDISLKNSSKEKLKKILKEFTNLAKQRVRFGPISTKGYRLWRIEAIAQELLHWAISTKSDSIEFFSSNEDLNHSHNKGPIEIQKRKAVSTTESQTRKRLKPLCKLSNHNVRGYEPFSFLQCHSNETGADDFSTQVWCCMFEPDINDSLETTNIVATCGGTTVCVIDCETAKVEARFHQVGEEFYSLSWTTMSINEHRTNVLVAAGCLGFLYLIHAKQGICYNRIKAHSFPIQTIKFSPSSATHLLTADKSGIILLIDIGVPALPDYTIHWKKLFSFMGLNSAPLKLLVKDDYLFCGAECGLFCWEYNAVSKLKRGNHSSAVKKIPQLCEVRIPFVKDEPLVDAIEVLDDDVIATKCAQVGVIFLWSFSSFVNAVSNLKRQKIKTVTVNLFAELKWATTQHCYINIAACPKTLSVLAGDDSGSIWVFDASFVKSKKSSADRIVKNMTLPTCIIPFPQCTRTNGSGISKFRQKVIYNDIACSSDMSVIVVGADSNVVGIFQKM